MDFSFGLACNDVLRIFCQLDTTFKGIINRNEADKASSDVLEYLEWLIECFCPSLGVLLFSF